MGVEQHPCSGPNSASVCLRVEGHLQAGLHLQEELQHVRKHLQVRTGPSAEEEHAMAQAQAQESAASSGADWALDEVWYTPPRISAVGFWL